MARSFCFDAYELKIRGNFLCCRAWFQYSESVTWDPEACLTCAVLLASTPDLTSECSGSMVQQTKALEYELWRERFLADSSDAWLNPGCYQRLHGIDSNSQSTSGSDPLYSLTSPPPPALTAQDLPTDPNQQSFPVCLISVLPLLCHNLSPAKMSSFLSNDISPLVRGDLRSQ
jgi:hypothetical protein